MKNGAKQKVYAFIDSQNLNREVKSAGWTVDFRKFRRYLQGKYGVRKAYLFIGKVDAQESLYANLQSMGYHVIFKPTKELPDGSVKGNVDADLVLHAMIEYPNYDKAIIVSGDGDFHGLVEHLVAKNKLLYLMVPNRNFSSLFKPFESYIVRVDKLRGALELRYRKPKAASRPPEAE